MRRRPLTGRCPGRTGLRRPRGPSVRHTRAIATLDKAGRTWNCTMFGRLHSLALSSEVRRIWMLAALARLRPAMFWSAGQEAGQGGGTTRQPNAHAPALLPLPFISRCYALTTQDAAGTSHAAVAALLLPLANQGGLAAYRGS